MDVFNLSQDKKTSIFYCSGGTSSWQSWQKPMGTKFVFIFAIGGGGAGGGGQTGAAGTTRRGAGGGGSSSLTTALYPSNLIPDTLYVNVGVGGVGGASNTRGASGSISYVSIQPNTTALNLLVASGNTPAGGGTQGSTSPSSGGNAGVEWSATGSFLASSFGLISPYPGQTGSAGTAGGTGLSVTISNSITGGAGGGGSATLAVDYPGGSITGSGSINTISGVIGSGSQGSSGIITEVLSIINGSKRNPLYFLGGAGGSSSDNASGGKGGNGSFGSGGGGGGSGQSTAGGGHGGNGGDGIVVIISI